MVSQSAETPDLSGSPSAVSQLQRQGTDTSAAPPAPVLDSNVVSPEMNLHQKELLKLASTTTTEEEDKSTTPGIHDTMLKGGSPVDFQSGSHNQYSEPYEPVDVGYWGRRRTDDEDSSQESSNGDSSQERRREKKKRSEEDMRRIIEETSRVVERRVWQGTYQHIDDNSRRMEDKLERTWQQMEENTKKMDRRFEKTYRRLDEQWEATQRTMGQLAASMQRLEQRHATPASSSSRRSGRSHTSGGKWQETEKYLDDCVVKWCSPNSKKRLIPEAASQGAAMVAQKGSVPSGSTGSESTKHTEQSICDDRHLAPPSQQREPLQQGAPTVPEQHRVPTVPVMKKGIRSVQVRGATSRGSSPRGLSSINIAGMSSADVRLHY